MIKLDLQDRKILYFLDINARMTSSEIARRLRIPKETVNYRIKRLEENGYIDHYYAIINGTRLGYFYSRIYFKFERISKKGEKSIVNFLRGVKECINIRLTDGPFDLVILLIHKNPSELASFMNEFNQSFGRHVQQKSINSLLATYKINQKFFYQGQEFIKRIPHGDAGNQIRLSPAEVKIINTLSTNAREKIVEIASKIRRSGDVVRYHMKSLEGRKVIEGYYALLDLDAFKREFIQVDICLQDPKKAAAIIDFFSKTDTCLFAYELVGKYDLSFELYTQDDHQLRGILEEFRELFLDAYAFYDVSHIYKKYTINWSPFESQRKEDNSKENMRRRGFEPR